MAAAGRFFVAQQMLGTLEKSSESLRVNSKEVKETEKNPKKNQTFVAVLDMAIGVKMG